MASDQTTVTITPAGEVAVNVRFGVGAGSGDVVGPASSTDEAIVRFNGTNGKTLQNGVATLTDAGVLAGASLSGAANTITNVSLTAGVSGILPVANGGTNAATAAAARTSLGLVIGTDVLSPSGSGASLTALNATQLTSGTVPDARFPATLPAASGVNLTALNATNLASGTVPDARFPATLPAVSGVNLTAINATQLTSGTVPRPRLPAGSVIQTVIASTNTSGSTATAIPIDDTIPQNGEGAEALTVTITPTSATSILIIEFDGFGGGSVAGYTITALFQDSAADALQATTIQAANAAYLGPLRLKHTMTAGTTSATTFKIRYGPNTGTAYFLRNVAGDVFSTATTATLTVKEIQV